MTTEQNEPQAQSAPQGQPQAQGQNGTGNQGHRRRRRRRNKGGKPQAAGAPQVNGQNGANPQSAGQNTQPAPAPQAGPVQHQPQKPKPQKRFFPKSNGQGGGGGFHNNGNGNGNGNGGGARRKGKQRRQQVFVGPMDHSYRGGSPGNVADANGNQQQEFRGMPHSGFYPENDFYSAPAPSAIREDAPTRIFCFIEDLFVLAKIQEVSKKLGIKVGFLKAEKDTLATLTAGDEDSRPSLIIFDLNNANAKPLTLIPKIKTKLKRGTSIIGFLSHLQGDLKVKAAEAGCDMVMPRSAFSQNLPNLLRRHGLAEEEEMDMAQA